MKRFMKGKSCMYKTMICMVYMMAMLGILTAVMALSACKGTTQTSSESGELVIGLTDAQGDFLSYNVDVASLLLTKANGTEVETLPISTRVDFAQYTDMTEFLTVATIPCGNYTGAVITIDYQQSDVWIEDDDGEAMQVQAVHDSQGDDIGAIDLAVRLEGRNSLTIAPGVPAHLTLDFDLSASNTVDCSDPESIVITVSPVLTAGVNLESVHIHRLRGSLKEVDDEQGTFEIILRPFVHAISDAHDRFGIMSVSTTANTVYDINGTVYTGELGLGQLTEQTDLTAVIVMGNMSFGPIGFRADRVYAGTSVPGGAFDVVRGNVTARKGDMLTMRGAALIRSGGIVAFNKTVNVDIGDATSVHRQLSADECSIDDVSVGQRIWVLGTLTRQDSDTFGMDAESGYMRIMLTAIRGAVRQVGEDSLVLNLYTIGGRDIGLFDFQGTGLDADNDADPDYYEVYADDLNISSLCEYDLLKIRGLVSPFGQAPEDFKARTIIRR